MKVGQKIKLSVLITILSSCTSMHTPYQPKPSFLEGTTQITIDSGTSTVSEAANDENQSGIKYLENYQNSTSAVSQSEDLAERFSDNDSVKITVDELPLKDFLHYVFGEVLDISYVLGEELQGDTQPVTLNIKDEISQKKLFLLSEELLVQRNYVVRFDDGIFYIHKVEGAGPKGDLAYGYGKDIDNVPNSSLDILQMVPLSYGLPSSFANSIRTLTKVQASPDFDRNTILLQGKRRDILRGLEFINLMDQPQYQGRHIGSYEAQFISIEVMLETLPSLLEQEGLVVNVNGRKDGAITLIPIERLGTMIIFANESSIVERVAYWASQLDKPAAGSEAQYFVYNPNYARASDLGESISNLISGKTSSLGNSTSAAQQNTDNSSSDQSSSQIVVSSESMSLVVDERSNSLIFKTTGTEYQSLLPLIKRLDVLPKQIMLEVVIAEVSLTDEFKQGVEFALASGSYGASTEGSFFGDGFGGLSYFIQSARGQIDLNLFQSNSLVNIVSRPSLVVRDGVKAEISVGTDIPVVSGVTTDPVNGSTQSVEYRKTGVELAVTPTVNAQGYIIMSINQTISNEVDSGGSTTAVNPSLFERSINTEVVAESGQTIVLGGLISENKSNVDTKVPFFGDIPIVGHLFKAKTTGGDKTELVLMVTARIVESTEEWQEIRDKFSKELKEITIY